MKLYQFYDENEYEDYYYVIAETKEEAILHLIGCYDHGLFRLSETYEIQDGLVIHG